MEGSLPRDNWELVQQIFLEAADLSPSARADMLDRACAGDASLRREVETLLRADEISDAAVETAVAIECESLLDDSPLAGTRLGPYRIRRELGRGGMGAVYLAQRDDEQYQKRVAIKVVKHGMDTVEVLRRFRHERQILAGLEHFYIARLLDGGTTDDGRPFFVMEYVDGRPVTDYCREHGLDLDARLRLFLRICDAVSYAHRAFVVHRDLKPSNIFVTVDGIPKLLDFGVAKLLSADVATSVTSTALAAQPFTPEYASPEQVRGLQVTTATDVYALGAILFELLTGTRAQQLETGTPAEIERVVCETEVRRPGAVPTALAAPRRLAADLDVIVLTAMHKARERRYQSVDQLAEDITRALDGLPVHARQDSVGYRARRFVARYRLPIAAATLVAVSLVGGATAAIYQALAARAAETRAERRLTELIELSDRTLYDVHAAIEGLPGATQARRQIVSTTLAFLQDLSKDAAQDDRLRFALSVSYSKIAAVLGDPGRPNLGDSRGALDNYRRAIELVESLLAKAPNNPDYLLHWVNTQADWAAVAARTSDNRRAVAVLRGLLPVSRRLPGLCPALPACLLAEGTVTGGLVDSVDATDIGAALEYARLHTESSTRALRAFPDDPQVLRDLALAHSEEAKVWNMRGDLSKAAAEYQLAIPLWERALVRDPTDVRARRNLMITYGNLGGNLGSPLYSNLGDTSGAREYYGKAVAIARELAKSDASDQLAQYDLAMALTFDAILDLPKRDWPASIAMLRESDTILQRLVAADPQSLRKLNASALVEEYLGRRLEGLGRRDEALQHYRASVAAALETLAHSPANLSYLVQLSASEGALAEALARRGDSAGLPTIRATIARAERFAVPDPDRDRVRRVLASAYRSLGAVHAAQGDWSSARTAAEHAVGEYRVLTGRGARVSVQEIAAAETLLEDCRTHEK